MQEEDFRREMQDRFKHVEQASEFIETVIYMIAQRNGFDDRQ